MTAIATEPTRLVPTRLARDHHVDAVATLTDVYTRLVSQVGIAHPLACAIEAMALSYIGSAVPSAA